MMVRSSANIPPTIPRIELRAMELDEDEGEDDGCIELLDVGKDMPVLLVGV